MDSKYAEKVDNIAIKRYDLLGVIVCKSTYIELGALTGLIGKTGVKPARSRHCNRERLQDMPLRL